MLSFRLASMAGQSKKQVSRLDFHKAACDARHADIAARCRARWRQRERCRLVFDLARRPASTTQLRLGDPSA